MRAITKERLQQIVHAAGLEPCDYEEVFDGITTGEIVAMARQLLAGLEQEPVYQVLGDGSWTDYSKQQLEDLLESKPSTLFRVAYAAPQLPQPAVPDEMYWQDAPVEGSTRAAAYATGWNACRAAMLQGADRPQNEPQNIPENIPATQFKPVADLYEVTVPGGRSTTFTKDAAEASDCRVMGWSVQEYVKLERYQTAMLQGAEPVSQHPELTVWYGSMPETNGKANWTAILHRKGKGIQDGMTIDRSEYPGRVLYAADRVRYLIGEKADRPCILDYDADAHSGYVKPGNCPVIPDGWVMVPADPTAEMLQSGISAHYERSQIKIHDRPAPGPMTCAYVAMLAAGG